MDLPKRERTFHFEHVGESGFQYEGQFTVLCRLNIAEKYSMELEKSRLMADMKQPTDSLFGIATAVGTLRAKVTEGPEWWKQNRGMAIEDEDALVALYNKVEEETQAWRKELEDKAKSAAKKSGK